MIRNGAPLQGFPALPAFLSLACPLYSKDEKISRSLFEKKIESERKRPPPSPHLFRLLFFLCSIVTTLIEFISLPIKYSYLFYYYRSILILSRLTHVPNSSYLLNL
ncbi:hypothetical protein I7I53_00987 [Histoplasma capsulatum var. duboisii H88]|uniref:Uncharacterized protein n=1 Tax=Ajellomyces capsulatus (strain H88) TaxID=544711 RepID=A0A8A1LIB5_AJEC8|nr:hypothetical protein I7I53_00987 [Histoplasma capsulatum var. duboisii H88]